MEAIFTTPCFIRKNTETLRDELKKLGIRPFLLDEELNSWGDNIKVFGCEMIAFSCSDSLNDCEGYTDCGTNEELFLAIAAKRNDTDKNQWFVDDNMGNDWIKSDTAQLCDYWIGESDVGDLFKTELECEGWQPFPYHKATVEELIQHFK